MGFCLRLLLVGAALVVALAALYQHLQSLLTHMGGMAGAQLLAISGIEAVKTGTGAELYTRPYGSGGQQEWWLVVQGGIKMLLGMIWLNPIWPHARLPTLWPIDGEEKLCHDLLNYMWVNPAVAGISYPNIYADVFAVKEWVRYCVEEHKLLSDEERRLLAPYIAGGGIPQEVNIPDVEDAAAITAQARASEIVHEETEKMAPEEIKEIVAASMAHTERFASNPEPTEPVMGYYQMLNIRKVPRIPSTWKDVGKAIATGRITRWDATKLLPKELFNMSLAAMARLEGEAATRIPIMGDGTYPTSLQGFADAREHLRQSMPLDRNAWSIHDGNFVLNQGEHIQDEAEVRDIFERMRDKPNAGYVHTRRMPKYHAKLPQNVEELLGLEEDIARSQSMLWMGSTPGGFHYDEEANVYVQLTGETFAFLVPQNYTDAFVGNHRHPFGSRMPNPIDIQNDPYLSQVPIFMLHMRAGDGITIHGRTLHRFMAQSHDRVALNWFFMPKWRRMEYTPADWYSKEAAKSLERLALRSLWCRSIVRLYEETNKGVVFMGSKLEYL